MGTTVPTPVDAAHGGWPEVATQTSGATNCRRVFCAPVGMT